MKLAISLALLSAFSTAQAAAWASLGKSSDGTEIFVDVSSIRSSGGIRRAWSKETHAPHGEKFNDKWINYSLSRDAFDCAEETSRHEAITMYLDDGSIEVMPTNLLPTAWAPVPPDTLLSAEMRFLCTLKLK